MPQKRGFANRFTGIRINPNGVWPIVGLLERSRPQPRWGWKSIRRMDPGWRVPRDPGLWGGIPLGFHRYHYFERSARGPRKFGGARLCAKRQPQQGGSTNRFGRAAAGPADTAALRCLRLRRSGHSGDVGNGQPQSGRRRDGWLFSSP